MDDAMREARNLLPHHEQMADAQRQCVPCKLCGGSAVISDAGTGAGYYIKCSGSTHWHDWTGCLIGERRVSGWAYNVMDWWNRLHADAQPSQAGLPDAEVTQRARQIYLDYMRETAEARGDRLADGVAERTLAGGNDDQHGVKIARKAILASIRSSVRDESDVRIAVWNVARSRGMNDQAAMAWVTDVIAALNAIRGGPHADES